MILTPTVFVLGAGASWHYGYPTGEKLVDRVIEMAERLRAFCHLALQAGGGWQGSAYVEERSDPPAYGRGWGRVMNDCNLLVRVCPVLCVSGSLGPILTEKGNHDEKHD